MFHLVLSLRSVRLHICVQQRNWHWDRSPTCNRIHEVTGMVDRSVVVLRRKGNITPPAISGYLCARSYMVLDYRAECVCSSIWHNLQNGARGAISNIDDSKNPLLFGGEPPNVALKHKWTLLDISISAYPYLLVHDMIGLIHYTASSMRKTRAK